MGDAGRDNGVLIAVAADKHAALVSGLDPSVDGGTEEGFFRPRVPLAVRRRPAGAIGEEEKKKLASLGYLSTGATTGPGPLPDPKDAIGSLVEHTIYIPTAPGLLIPIIEIVPLQLLAYYIAVRRGCDVDQPRNLAKSVTVE